MEKLINPYDRENMRMAMLKHEETFKEQVYELHRLYQIQKILMENIENYRGMELSQRGWNSTNACNNLTQNTHHISAQQKPQMKFDLERPAEGHIAESNGEGVLELIDETEIELTLGPSSFNHRRKKANTLVSSDSGHSFSSSSSGSNKISPRSDARREELSGIKNSLDIKKPSRQERLMQSPWIFQMFNLNMT